MTQTHTDTHRAMPLGTYAMLYCQLERLCLGMKTMCADYSLLKCAGNFDGKIYVICWLLFHCLWEKMCFREHIVDYKVKIQ